MNISLDKPILKAVLFDPSQGTSNLGDFIIRRAVDRQLERILENYFVVRYGTHTPLATLGSIVRGRRNQVVANCLDADLKLICGTNILKENLFHLNNDWVVGPFSSKLYGGAVLIGAGLSGGGDETINRYTRAIYQRALSHEHVHSVRDNRAAQFLERLGFQAINTGCPTTWSLQESSEITPNSRRETVIFTLTDYAKDNRADEALVRALQIHYSKVVFWPQGVGDLAYFASLNVAQAGVRILAPTLESYLEFLSSCDSDYIGTRLHGGILAQELGARAIIIAVDNRARDMAATTPIICIERSEVSGLESLITEWPVKNGGILGDSISEWKQQFQR